MTRLWAFSVKKNVKQTITILCYNNKSTVVGMVHEKYEQDDNMNKNCPLCMVTIKNGNSLLVN